MHFADSPNRTALDQLDHPTIVRPGVNLRPHLRRHSSRPRGLGHETRLVYVTRQRLLAVNMLLAPQRRQGRKGMRVLRR